MSRLPSASTSRRVSTKDLLHGILHMCEQELVSNMAISAYPLVRKKQFVRSLNRVAVRIGRFLALYRCHISSEVVLRGTRGSGSYLKVSDRASALMWEVLEEIRLKTVRNTNSIEPDVGTTPENSKSIATMTYVKSWIVPIECKVEILRDKNIRVISHSPNYCLDIHMKRDLKLNALRISGRGVSREVMKKVIVAINGLLKEQNLNTLVRVHKVMERVYDVFVLNDFVRYVLKLRDFFRVSVELRNECLFLVFRLFSTDFSVSCHSGCVYITSHVPRIGYSTSVWNVTDESVLSCLNDLKRVVIERMLTVLWKSSEELFWGMSILSRRIVDSRLVVSFATHTIVEISVDFDSGNYVCSSEWNTEKLESSLNTGDLGECRLFFRDLLINVFSRIFSYRLCGNDLHTFASKSSVRLLDPDNISTISRLLANDRGAQIVDQVLTGLQKQEVLCQRSGNVLKCFMEPFYFCTLKVKYPQYWCLSVGFSDNDLFGAFRSMKIVSRVVNLRMGAFLCELIQQLSKYVYLVSHSKGVIDFAGGYSCLLSQTEFLAKMPRENMSYFLMNMLGLNQLSSTIFECDWTAPRPELIDFRVNSAVSAHFKGLMSSGKPLSSFGSFLMGSSYPLSNFMSLFSNKPWYVHILSADESLYLYYGSCAMNVRLESPSHFRFVIPTNGLATILHVPLSAFKQCMRPFTVKYPSDSQPSKHTSAKFDPKMLPDVKSQIETFFTEKEELEKLGFSNWHLDDQKTMVTARFNSKANWISLSGSLSSSGISIRVTDDQGEPAAIAVRDIFAMSVENRAAKLKITSFVVSLINQELPIGKLFLSELYEIFRSELGERVNWATCLMTGVIENSTISFTFVTKFAGDFQVTLMEDFSSHDDALAQIVGIGSIGEPQMIRFRRDFRQWAFQLDVPQFWDTGFDLSLS